MGRDGSSGGGAGTKVVKPSSCMVKRSEMGDLGVGWLEHLRQWLGA